MLTDLYARFGGHALAGADLLRKWTYDLYAKADDLHYFLEKWVRILDPGETDW